MRRLEEGRAGATGPPGQWGSQGTRMRRLVEMALRGYVNSVI